MGWNENAGSAEDRTDLQPFEKEIDMSTIHHQKRPHDKSRQRGLLLAALAVLFLANGSAQNLPDVTAMSVEDLMNVQVTSVSKRTQKLADAAAAIYVISQDDIRRSGANSIPEALRLVPGIQVARIDETSGPSAHAASTGVSPTNCWY